VRRRRRDRKLHSMTPLPSPSSPAPRMRPLVLDGSHLPEHLVRMERVARSLCASDRRADADADDLVQETLERVLRRPRRIHGDAGAYLLQALRRTHLDRRRAQKARIATVPEPEGFEAPDPHAADRMTLRSQARAIVEAIGALPAAYRDAVLALDVAGFSAREASRATGVPAGTLESRAYRGRARVMAAVAA
jgi:RNA polymerase sigma factor (sigma-70 family)